MSRVHLVLACGASLISAVGCSRAETRRSPFALFARNDMRAGLSFDALREAAKNESVKQYDCVPLWAKAQRCTVEIQNGTLTAIVDSTGRVLRLVGAPDATVRMGVNVHGQLNFRDMVRDLRASWDSVGTMSRNDDDPLAPQLYWVEPSHRWGASLWYSRVRRADVPLASEGARNAELSMSVPESIGVTDLPAYTLFTQSHPPAIVAIAEAPRPIVSSALPSPPSSDDIITMMRSDLRAITIAEESALHKNGVYETTLERLQLTSSPGVRVELVHPTGDGWTAVATHGALPEMSCVVYAGDVSPLPTTRKQGRHGGAGEVMCDQP